MRTQGVLCRALAAVCLFAVCASAPAALDSGLSGVVKDPSGAVIPGAAVTLSDAGGKIVSTAVADASGNYVFATVAPGRYSVEAVAGGFQHFRQPVEVEAGGAGREVDITLQLPSQAEEVKVNADSPQVQVETSDTALSSSISAQRATEVPLNGRSFTDLLSTQSGVTPVATNTPPATAGAGSFGAIPPSGDLNPGQFSMNGQRETSNGFLLNGANVVESIAGAAAIIPNLDSISEFRLLSSNFDAQYGNYSGGLTLVTTKQGGDQLHGSAFEFLRNTALDARGFFDPDRAAYRQNQFGGTLGGPMHKGNLYAFADYQGNRTTEGVESGLIPVPTSSERAGYFAPSALTGSVAGPYLAQWLTQSLGYKVTQGEPFSQIFASGVIPQSAWSLPAQRLLQYVPQGNASTGDFSSAAYAEMIHDNKTSLRLDGHTHLGTLSGYYFYDGYTLDNPYPTQQGGANVPGFDALSSGVAQLFTLQHTMVLGSSRVNDALFSYMRNINHLGIPKGGLGVSLADQGFASSANAGILPLYPDQEGVESVVFNSFSLGTVPFRNDQTNQTYSFRDTFSDSIGKHLLVAGVQAHFDRVLQNINLISNGEFQFYGTQTGVDFADFLLGLPSTYQQSYTPSFDNLNHYVGVFAQDSWRVRSNLTLNYGVRWEFMPAWSLAGNESATFVPGAQSQKFPGAPAGYVFPGDTLPNGSMIPSSIAPTSWGDFSPRMGVAWSPASDSSFLHALTGGAGKSSVRAGFGRFFTAVEGLTTSYQTGNPPYGLQYASPESPFFSQPFLGSLTGTVYPQPFPLTEPPANVSRANPDNSVNWALFSPVSGAVGYYYKNPVPYALNYFLSIERQAGPSTVVTLDYIGSQAHHLVTLLSANPGNPALCLSLSQTNEVAPGSATCGPFGESNVYSAANGTVVNGTRTLLGSNFGSDAWFYNYGNSAYNSLQVNVKHTARRLVLNASYTYGKSLDDGSNLQEQLYPFAYHMRRGISSFDIRHNFVATYRYELPTDKLGGPSRLTKGWALTGITRFSSGLPVTMIDYGDNSLIGTNNQGVNSSGVDLPDLAAGPLEINHHPENGRPYVNPSLFSVPALGTPGDSPRRPFYGPGMENFDMALLKTTQLFNDKSIEFRWETFNTFNHSQFFGAASVNGNINSSTFGNVVSSMPPRLMQVAVKFTF
jgi:hypothetical protein